MKFPAAPESIRAIVSVFCPLIFRVTGISNIVEGLRFKLTAAGLRGERAGQVALMCPDTPQYKPQMANASLSLSSSLRGGQEVVMWFRLEPKRNESEDESEEGNQFEWPAQLNDQGIFPHPDSLVQTVTSLRGSSSHPV